MNVTHLRHAHKYVAVCRGLLAASATVSGCAGARVPIRLEPEEHTVLHLRDMASIEVATDQKYSLDSAGDALRLTRKREHSNQTVFTFQAVHTGDETLLTTPDVPQGHCIACVTVHYFVTVVP